MMTTKERWRAAVKFEPVDRLPFWPKLTGQYPPAQETPFHDMALDDLHAWMGSDRQVWTPGFVREVRTSTELEVCGDHRVRRSVYTSPHGTAELIERYDAVSQSWHPTRFPVQNVEDIRVLTDCFRDCRVEINEDQLSRARERVTAVGDAAFTACGIGISALMLWVEYFAGLENGHYLLIEHEPEVLDLFDAVHRVLRRTTELFCAHAPCDALYFSENTSTTLISPDQYRRYCYPQILEYAQIAREAGRLVILHMCGHLKALLPDLATIPVAGFEAFTSPPVGNTTLLDGRSACPRICLIGGTNAVLWTRPAEAIIAQLEADLEALPHHRGLILSSAGVMPSLAAPATIKRVCEWIKAYPVRT